MQKGSFTQEFKRYRTESVVRNINALSKYFREKDWPVIFIQHDGTSIGNHVPHTEEWELLDELNIKDAAILPKTANDAFYKTQLKELCRTSGVKEVVITGCATDFCVAATVQGAINSDLDVTVVSDGHTTSDRPSVSAKDVVDHYNWVWQNMIPTQSSISVIDTNALLVK